MIKKIATLSLIFLLSSYNHLSGMLIKTKMIIKKYPKTYCIKTNQSAANERSINEKLKKIDVTIKLLNTEKQQLEIAIHALNGYNSISENKFHE